jgi:ABC-type multidrug transport system ATPase subunit
VSCVLRRYPQVRTVLYSEELPMTVLTDTHASLSRSFEGIAAEPTLLQIAGVSRRYGAAWALRDINLDLRPGVLGLLGPNGAGKSTLMRIIATLDQPTSGSVHWRGQAISRTPDVLRNVLGYLPQDVGVYPNLSATEFLAYIAAVKGLEPKSARRRIDELLTLLNLTAAAKRPIGSYSGGMRQRVGIAQALLNDPELLIVDEPTVGLDPEERVRFRNLLGDLAGERLVILSTHIVSDVEATATSIALIAGGRLLAHATPDVLLTAAVGQVWEWEAAADALPDLRRRFLVSGMVRSGNGVRMRVVSPTAPAPTAILVPPSLEDAYLLALQQHRAEVKE